MPINLFNLKWPYYIKRTHSKSSYQVLIVSIFSLCDFLDMYRVQCMFLKFIKPSTWLILFPWWFIVQTSKTSFGLLTFEWASPRLSLWTTWQRRTTVLDIRLLFWCFRILHGCGHHYFPRNIVCLNNFKLLIKKSLSFSSLWGNVFTFCMWLPFVREPCLVNHHIKCELWSGV